MNFQGQLLKETCAFQTIKNKTPLPIWNGKLQTKKSIKSRIWKTLGFHSGMVWGHLGRLLDALGSRLAVLRALQIKSFQAWVQDELQKACWVDFAKICGRFGDGFGMVWGSVFL